MASQIQPVAIVDDEAPARKRGTKRTVFFFLAFAAVLLGVYLSPIRTWLANTGRVHEVVQALGVWVYVVGVVGIALLVACGVPRLLLCMAAGATLGFWRGWVVGEVGTVLGYYGIFLFIRWGGGDWALHRWPKLRKWSELVEGQGLFAVILLRQVPIHGTITNLGLGLSRIKHRHFLLGTAIGVIPEAIPTTLVGAGLGQASANAIGAYLAIAAVAFALIWIGCAWGIRTLKRRRGIAILAAEAVMGLAD